MPQPFASRSEIFQGNDFCPQLRHHREFNLLIVERINFKALFMSHGKIIRWRFIFLVRPTDRHTVFQNYSTKNIELGQCRFR